MKYLLLAVMLATIGLLTYRIVVINKREYSKLVRDVVRLHIVAASTVFVYALTMLAANVFFAKAVYGIYLWCTDFLLLFFYVYIRDYTQSFELPRPVSIVIFTSICIDGLLLGLNIFRDCLFSMRKGKGIFGDDSYRVVDRTNLFLYHKCVAYLFTLLILTLLIFAIIRAARIYVKQYLAITYCFLFTIGINMSYEIFEFDFDYSVLSYGIIAVLIYYFTFSYVPKGLVEMTLTMVVRNINDGVVCMDLNGRCIYANANARQIFHCSKNNEIIEEYYRTWTNGRRYDEIEETNWQSETEINGEVRYFLTSYKGIRDEEGLYIGCYFVMHDETEHCRKLAEEKYRNRHDMLTGLFNREYFYELVENQIRENPKVNYSILCVDIQNFKIINDVFGIEKGDEFLKSVADTLRGFATGDTICARLTGDRFAMCVRDSKIQLEQYLEAMDEISKIGDDHSYCARIYTGICPIRDAKTLISVYCDRAFLAIESIKGDYQQSIAYYDDELRKRMLEGQHMVNDFRRAIAKQEFQIFLQPQVDMDGKMLGAEALVRWFRPVYGMILPENFIGIFERSGLISSMDQYVWDLACKLLQRWKHAGNEQYYISVNVSPKDFYFMDVYQTLTTLVECYEINPDNLHLEITETSVMKDAKKHLALIDKLREYGFQVVMDDFGRGYSSLNMLQYMNIDALKIDMEFLRKNDDSERSRMILEMILSLAKELEIQVIAEGTEQKDQLRYMQKLGCESFQGYYFAKPMPVCDFEKAYF